VACSSVSGKCLVVWEETESIHWNQGIRARLVDSDGTPLAGEFVLVEGSGYHINPEVVHNPVRDEFLVVHDNRWNSGVIDVSAHRVRADNGLLLSSAIVATGSDGERTWPRVAHLADRDQYLVTYTFEDATEDEEVRAKIAAGDLLGVGSGPELSIAATVGNDRYAGVGAHGDGYLVAWLHQENSFVNGEIRARRLAGDGSPLGTSGGFLVSGFPDTLGGVVSGVRFNGDQGFFVGWGNRTAGDTDQHGRYVELGSDEAAFFEFPSFATQDWDGPGRFACNGTGQCLVVCRIQAGVHAGFVTAWRVLSDGFEDGTVGGWSVVVGASP
jgi:hypothetical protein